jgi:oligopeptide/dipeptide ABC transporter ATP-binding protein
VAIARALATDPEVLICDEPVASVDAPTRGLLLDLLDRLRRERGLALLFISHDLAAVSRITSRVAVMYLGRIVEHAGTYEVLRSPRMPYTRALISAVPTGDPATRARRIVLTGESPSPVDPPAGCPFHPRCPHPLKDETCRQARPPLAEGIPGHWAACWKQGEVVR